MTCRHHSFQRPLNKRSPLRSVVADCMKMRLPLWGGERSSFRTATSTTAMSEAARRSQTHSIASELAQVRPLAYCEWSLAASAWQRHVRVLKTSGGEQRSSAGHAVITTDVLGLLVNHPDLADSLA
jgi:hypothetical protein